MTTGHRSGSGSGGDGDGGEPGPKAVAVHEHLEEIKTRLDLIIGIVEGSSLLAHEKSQMVNVLQGVRQILLAQCERQYTTRDYYPELD